MNDPATTASSQGTPSKKASGLKAQPSSNSRVKSGMPNHPPTPPRTPLTTAINATNANSMAPTFKASDSPEEAPVAAASITFTGATSSSTSSSTELGVSVSGCNILANNKPPGADMKQAAIKYSTGTPMSAYPASALPATEANPPTITANNSDCVMPAMYGLTTKGASVWPTKMLAVALMDSAFDVPRTRCNAPPMMRITHFMMPTWYRTAMSAAKNTMIGNTLRANTNPAPSPVRPPNRKSMPALPYPNKLFTPSVIDDRRA